MSIEAALAKLTAAVEKNNELLAAASGTAAEKPEATKTASGPSFWKTADGSAFGSVANVKELEKVKEDHASVETIEKSEYLELKKASDAAAKKKAAADKKAKDDAAAAKKAEVAEEAEVEHPSEDDLIAAFTKYLPKDLDKEERAKRAPKVKAYLQEQGAKKATEIKPEQRADAIAFVEGLVAELDGDASDDDDMI